MCAPCLVHKERLGQWGAGVYYSDKPLLVGQCQQVPMLRHLAKSWWGGAVWWAHNKITLPC